MKLTFTILLNIASVICFSQNAHTEKVLEHRSEQNIEMIDSTSSPLTKEDRKTFKGLNYYDINESFVVKAKFEQGFGEWFDMATSSGKTKKYRIYGTVTFKLNEEKFTLNVYQSQSLMNNPLYKNYLFIPFTDDTNGLETYGAGRYLDCTMPDSDMMIIDFNLCYNPYCAYNDGYSCPIPPKENYLNLRIEAGEKVFHENH